MSVHPANARVIYTQETISNINLLLVERARRRRAITEMSDLGEWLCKPDVSLPSWNWSTRLARVWIGLLDLMTAGVINRLMVFAPPRHGKTELFSVRYPVYRMERAIRLYHSDPDVVNPNYRIIFKTFNQTHANRMSKKARAIGKNRLVPNKKIWAANEWQSIEGATYMATGSGAAGVGANLLVIDDPFKNRKEANSLLMRDTVWDSYSDDLYPRLEPNGQIIMTFARWHENDLAGRIIESDTRNDWYIVNFPAIAESQEERDEWAEKWGLPVGMPDPLNRKEGEALLPERYPIDKLLQIQKTVEGFPALYQGRPRPREGQLFNKDWFKPIERDAIPRTNMVHIVYVDKAGTYQAGKASAFIFMSAHIPTKRVYIMDCMRGQWEAVEREEKLIEFCRINALRIQAGYFNVTVEEVENGVVLPAYLERIIGDEPSDRAKQAFTVWLEQEGGSGGKESAQATVRNLALYGYKCYYEPVHGDKTFRAEPMATFASSSGIYYPKDAKWSYSLKGEFADFPFGTFKDRVDAGSGAFNKLRHYLLPTGQSRKST